MNITSHSSTMNDTQHQRGSRVNVGSFERWAFALGGGALAAYGLTRRNVGGVVLALLGGSLIRRGVTGHCELYQALGIDHQQTTNDAVARDVHVERSVTLDRSPAELYQFWRNFENLPRFMKHLESVTPIDAQRSHWVAIGPAGERVEWDAEIYNEKEDELIAWRTLSGSDLVHAGTVRFEAGPSDGTTHVRVTMNYNIPGGKLTAGVANFLGQSPERLIDDDLNRLKQLLSIKEEPYRAGSMASGGGGGTLMGRAHSEIG
jgi:uncharacterized membrane protein